MTMDTYMHLYKYLLFAFSYSNGHEFEQTLGDSEGQSLL